ncbi:acyl-CoA reductase [Streptosporangium sandarakinum]|uniref:acyl-CoA reductase n=1 Tax=Streptosporangium sandarakinum TaxID=1260955 RepID=UPI0034204E8D
MGAPTIPAFVRGETVWDDPVAFGGTGEACAFRAPDPVALLDRLPLTDPLRMRDLAEVTTSDVVDYLAELGPRLRLSVNGFLREALEHSAAWSDMTPPVLSACYEQLPSLFTPEAVRAVAEGTVGSRFLDGWQEVASPGGGTAAVRAVGARAVHIIAGNNPIIAAITIIRNALVRGDAVIKTPANDPLTAVAVARTMAETAPGHPLTRHLAVAYWKGGDAAVEDRLYQPGNIDKIVAWGGLASVRHVTRYIQPGVELVTLDPKLSATIVGAEAFADEASMAETARLAAVDVGALNQLGCFNARVVHVVTGLDPAGLERAEHWGELLHREILRLPAAVSTPARWFDPELRASLRALRTSPDWYRVIGGHDAAGAVVVSRVAEPVDFHTALSGRVANVVPVASPRDALKAMNAYTQTVGVYPESLKRRLRDLLPLYGVQRLVSLGYATRFRPDVPQDAMEPVRRMVKWIVDESCSPDDVHPLGHLDRRAEPWERS